MTPRLRLAAAARALVPDRQGDLDSLCGLYAIINAYRLAVYPLKLSRPHRLKLFEAGAGFLSRKRWLRHMLVDGIEERAWFTLCEHVVATANRALGTDVTVRAMGAPGLPAGERLALVRYGIKAGTPVILCLEGRLHHWTVAARYTEASLILFDSGGRRHVALSGFGDGGGYRISADGIAQLMLSSRMDKARSPP